MVKKYRQKLNRTSIVTENSCGYNEGRKYILSRQGETEKALKTLEISEKLYELFPLDAFSGMKAISCLNKAEILCGQGREEEAMEELLKFTDASCAAAAKGQQEPGILFLFDRLSWTGEMKGKTYYLENAVMLLEQSEALEPLKEREQYRELVRKLRKQ